ncbi:hypothetical protein MMU07_12130 [Aquiflexum sp. LQ15W]|uniref:hypothetical protein n=1 Tax=Cognataquiflexum nitidum TaxID=2922272 RepID=UPI001F12C987|nr:hypothetical protein [Cognataquiflexum nitidum]MCH6200330.1 hypothetical protein [Cognataquiflexum nitidum]
MIHPFNFAHVRKLAGVLYMLLTVFLMLASKTAEAKPEPDGEAMLIFSYPSLGQAYLNVAFFDDVPFLPLGEVLSLLYIGNERTSNGKGLQGTFPSKSDNWLIDPLLGLVTIKGSRESLPADKFYMGGMDIYLHPDYYSRIFGLNFLVNFNALSLSLTAEYPLPIDERQKRETLRRKLQQSAANKDQSDAPLLYGRDRKLFAPGMLDYNLNYNLSSENRNLGILMNAGMEFLGGDLQGLYSGTVLDGKLFSSFSGARWRYVLPGGLLPDKNAGMTGISVGQINTTGLNNSVGILGVGITNNPVIPRMKLDVFVIDGYTEPDSEVELLIGGQLVDFLRADDVGYYRFNAPITFGVVRLAIRIYTPQGEVKIEERQLQIPFTFLPKGFVTYNLQAGIAQTGIDSLDQDLVGHADIAYGVTNALTVRAGVDNGAVFGKNMTYGVFGLSARILQQYLLNVDVLPDRYYQASASVFYANNTSINAQFTEFVPESEFNLMGQIREANINAFFPFKTFGKFSGFRITGERQWYESGFRTNYQTDFNTQIGRIVARVNYRARISGVRDTGTGIEPPNIYNAIGQFTASMTYTLKRDPSVPVFVRGMFFRGQYRYDTYNKTPVSYNLMMSQTLFKMGRLTMGYEVDAIRKKGQFQLGFLYDFSGLRTSTQFSASRNTYSAQQAITGSLGIDPSGYILPDNRDQVTRSGVAVRLFIDANENGVFDQGEVVVPAKAVRLDRSANMLLGSDGILRITQLQAYWKYQMEVDIHALPNPNLAPKVKRFTFVAEPNRYRSIDIPLYQTGIIEGFVVVDHNGKEEGLGGLRLILEKLNDNEPLQLLRTFTDGGFYVFGMMPGKYRLYADPKQLEFMNVTSDPGILEFEIKALADGDYLENLNIKLRYK